MCGTSTPLTEPDLWISHIRLFRLTHRTLWPYVKVVHYLRFRERIAFQIVGKLLPAHLFLLTAPVEPFVHQLLGDPAELRDARVVFADPVILDMSSELGLENLPPFLGFDLVPDFPQPLVHRLALGDKPLAARPSPYLEFSSS